MRGEVFPAEESVEECARVTTGKEHLMDKGNKRPLEEMATYKCTLTTNGPLNRLVLLEDKLAPATGATAHEGRCPAFEDNGIKTRMRR